MKKRNVTPIALTLLALTLAGCGEDDIIYGPGDSNGFTISSFDRSSNAIARMDETYRTGERDIKKTNIIGNYNKNIDNLKSSVVLADKFEGTLEDKNIEVKGRTVNRPVYEKNNNNKFNYETTYRTLSLAGVDARDYDANSRRGIFTDLNNYSKIPTNISFPSGSICYIPITTSARSFFVFNNNDKTGYQALDKWITYTENQFDDNRPSRTIKLNIGANNEHKAAQVKFFAFNKDPEFLHNGIDYSDFIYEAHYIDKNQTRPNEDSIRGKVDCMKVNDIAADFLQARIKEYY